MPLWSLLMARAAQVVLVLKERRLDSEPPAETTKMAVLGQGCISIEEAREIVVGNYLINALAGAAPNCIIFEIRID